MISIQSYVRRGQYTLRKWIADPRIHMLGRAGACVFSGLLLSAASISNCFLPLSMGLVCACSGWGAVLSALGGAAGYWLFWGAAGQQGIYWLVGALAVTLLLANQRLSEGTPLLLPAAAGLIVAATGVICQSVLGEDVPITIYLLRIFLAAGSTWVFTRVLQTRNPLLDWLACALGVLALAQIAPVPWFGLGYFASGILAVTGAFPAAALAGLALDLARVTPIPMAAVMTLSYLARLLPEKFRGLFRLSPGIMYLLIMQLTGNWDLMPLPGLLLGGIAGSLLPARSKVAHRRGETGAAQVRLEMAAGVLSQTEQILLEAPVHPVDEDTLVSKAAERACGGCPCRKGCKDASRILQLPGLLLHKPLLTTGELPIICRKSGRFLAELHRSQEQLRSIRADRERQKEYRSAVVQQYQFLSEYLQDLSDQLARKNEGMAAVYEPEVQIFGNRPEAENGDRCLRFAGIQCKYYVLLCDGMGTGMGAVQEGRSAASILRRLLGAGYPAEYALRSLNSLCALRERAGAVTVDLAELQLDSGKTVLYKWGAAPSYTLSAQGAEKIGTATAPPGLSVTDCQEASYRLTLRRGQTLVMVSDGVPEDAALRFCMEAAGSTPAELATRLLSRTAAEGQDDATVITVRLRSAIDNA